MGEIKSVRTEQVDGEYSGQSNTRVVEAISHRLPSLSVPDEPVVGSPPTGRGVGRHRRFTSTTATTHFYPGLPQPSVVTRDNHDGGRCAC